jgi:hypothetical protein
VCIILSNTACVWDDISAELHVAKKGNIQKLFQVKMTFTKEMKVTVIFFDI